MEQTKNKAKKFRFYLKWVLWVLFVQLILVNVSAAFYAYKLSHFYDRPEGPTSSKNIFEKTWKLFVGPKFYKNTIEPVPPFPVETVRFKTSDDINIDAWYSATDSAKACVIFFHGISVNKSFVSREAAIFRSWGYNVMLVDFRAHGKSEGNNSSFGIKETEEVQKAFLLAKEKGNTRILLYGVSLGAGVCIKAVSENLVDPVAIIADMPFGSLHQHMKSRGQSLGFPSEPFGTLVTLWLGIESGHGVFSHNVARYAKNVSCPVLVQWGKEDNFVSRQEVETVFGSLSSKNKKLEVYEDIGHESFVASDPNSWQTRVKSFLATLP